MGPAFSSDLHRESSPLLALIEDLVYELRIWKDGGEYTDKDVRDILETICDAAEMRYRKPAIMVQTCTDIISDYEYEIVQAFVNQMLSSENGQSLEISAKIRICSEVAGHCDKEEFGPFGRPRKFEARFDAEDDSDSDSDSDSEGSTDSLEGILMSWQDIGVALMSAGLRETLKHFEDPAILVDASESESEEEESLALTEVEKEFHARLLAQGRNEKAKVIASNQKAVVNRFTRNAFLPAVTSRWVEAQSREVGDKLWDLLTFNYAAPIHEDSYRFLASLTEEEMKKCNEKALTKSMELIRGDHPLTPDNMKLPVVGDFDATKCAVSPCMLQVRGFMGHRVQTAIVELKRLWNVGRPFLKCQCILLDRGDCGKNISWFDNVFWYLLSDLHYLFPQAPSLRARIRMFRALAKTTWRAPVLASVVFTHMREIMVSMAYSVVNDPTRNPQNILDNLALMLHKFPKTMAKLILPSRYIRTTRKKRKESVGSFASVKKARMSQQSTLEFYIAPPAQQMTVTPVRAVAVVVEGTTTPPDSSVTIQHAGNLTGSSKTNGKNPRGRMLAKGSLFKS
ncbi:hypothetical protein CBR_g19864 [Chara braunii]|uniref:Uncharacterized protein n=1 Tax=Chara braunii TaxID=69332 RepID=A0A388KYY1_CHABU|nr:hypothetical protein CBR_g19864 [Chara braunii]|eukprot:GBG75228.1 hypothetical protein CBR_g19864 [Chara braunii]